MDFICNPPPPPHDTVISSTNGVPNYGSCAGILKDIEPYHSAGEGREKENKGDGAKII